MMNIGKYIGGWLTYEKLDNQIYKNIMHNTTVLPLSLAHMKITNQQIGLVEGGIRNSMENEFD